MSGCDICSIELEPTNITNLCRECKHIQRDRRAGFTAAEVPLADARANFMAAFRGHYRSLDASAVYMNGACRKCARYVARNDTGCCDWCSRPWRPRPPKQPKLRPRTAGSATADSTRLPAITE